MKFLNKKKRKKIKKINVLQNLNIKRKKLIFVQFFFLKKTILSYFNHLFKYVFHQASFLNGATFLLTKSFLNSSMVNMMAANPNPMK